jgi:hypothetical protein
VFEDGDIAEREVLEIVPTVKSLTVVSGLAGVFSGFAAYCAGRKTFALGARCTPSGRIGCARESARRGD